MFPNMIRTSSRVIGGPSCEEAVEESEAVETVRDDEVDLELGENGGGLGGAVVLKGAGCPTARTTLEDQRLTIMKGVTYLERVGYVYRGSMPDLMRMRVLKKGVRAGHGLSSS